MSQFPGQRFEVAGYTDDKGSDQYNDKLSLRRAQTVADILIKRGISKDDLVVKGYGKRIPAEKEDYANRRVEIRLFNEK